LLFDQWCSRATSNILCLSGEAELCRQHARPPPARAAISSQIVGMVIGAISLVYLCTPGVRAAFGRV
jgi:hypothetical protein